MLKTNIILFCLSLMANSSQVEGWRGIKPLHSTRADVERTLGAPKESTGVASTYETGNEKVRIFYSTSLCKKGISEGWNVPRDTVTSLTVYPKAKLLVASLKLDETKYEKQRDPHLGGIVYYISREDGIFIQAGTVEGGEDISSITYEAAAADSHLSCSRQPRVSIESNGKVFDPHIRIFDEYSDVPFEDEKERLENFAIQLLKEPQMKGYIIVYAGRRARVGEARTRAVRAKNYLVNKHGVDDERIITIDGGHRERLEVELYALPHGVPPPTYPTVAPSEVQLIRASKNNRHSSP